MSKLLFAAVMLVLSSLSHASAEGDVLLKKIMDQAAETREVQIENCYYGKSGESMAAAPQLEWVPEINRGFVNLFEANSYKVEDVQCASGYGPENKVLKIKLAHIRFREGWVVKVVVKIPPTLRPRPDSDIITVTYMLVVTNMTQSVEETQRRTRNLVQGTLKLMGVPG